MAEPVDWQLAAATATRIAPGGPPTSTADAAATVAQLRELALAARAPVREVTRLSAPDDLVAAVVDRPAWIEANTGSMKAMVEPLGRRLPEGKMHAVASRVNALQVGAMLGWLSTKVLGQFEALPPAGQPARLLLVAPNIVSAEEELDADPRDFRMWVCLHEETHRVQFGANPWLSGYFADSIGALVTDLDVSPLELARRAVGGVRAKDDELPLMAVLQSPEQRELMSRLLGLMSLLEGHADWVMDNAADDVVPSSRELREKFEERRRGSGPLDIILRKVLGLDAKMAQYREGARFVRIVVELIGLDRFNEVWTGPDQLPSLHEIREPADWIARVHPDAA